MIHKPKASHFHHQTMSSMVYNLCLNDFLNHSFHYSFFKQEISLGFIEFEVIMVKLFVDFICLINRSHIIEYSMFVHVFPSS